MSDTLIIALVAGLPAAVTAVAALFTAIKVSYQVHEVHLSMNGRFDQWLDLAKSAAYSEGYRAALEHKEAEEGGNAV